MVAQFETQGFLEIASNFFIPAAVAEITGLEPIQGADVELIRVDNEGNQVGDVLARTATSITGDYRLTLPQGVNLAGNLILRITGANHSLRAQVVEKTIDINPASEFVLRKFIETGADLEQLVVEDVVKLSGKVKEFDLAAGANLDEMFNTLEQEVGAFVETEVATISAAGADVSLIAGDYANAALAFQLHDDDGRDGYGTFAHDMWLGQFKFADGGSGTVNMTYLSEDSVYGNLNGQSIANSYVYYEASPSDGEDPETFPGSFNTKGVLSVQGEFEEEIGDADYPYGWRYPATTYVFQQVADKGLFFGLTHEAAVRYGLTDSYDALDPNNRQGDEVFRSLEVFARKPANLTDADLSGDYGRVYFGSQFYPGSLELRAETNTVTFSSGFSADLNAGLAHTIFVDGNGADYADQDVAAETGISLNIAADGTIAGDSGAVGFVSEDASYLDFSESYGSYVDGTSTPSDFAEFNKTMMVKLPSSVPDLSAKKYRLMMVSSALEGGSTGFIAMFASQFNTYMTMNSNTAGSVTGNFSEISKNEGLGSDITASVDKVSAVEFSMEVASNGATTITVADADGDTKFEGFFNEDASLGVFTVGYLQTDAQNYDELGLAVLVDVTGK
ncbi:hypothetical protein AQ621_15075 [Marinobacter sp. P4B1]|nr:hypothetical protein AQ621_15075 [Marinobacter sp. P4B1]